MNRRRLFKKNVIAEYQFFNHLISFNQRKLTDKTEKIKFKLIPTLFHEYFHYYIQFNSLYYLEGTLFHYINVIKYMSQNFNINATLTNNFNDDLLAEWKYRMLDDYYEYGDVINLLKIDKLDFIGKDLYQLNAPFNIGSFSLEKITLKNFNNQYEKEFLFGENFINEGMANILETHINKSFGLDENEQLPYNVLSKISEDKKYSHLVMLVIGDISMQSISPGNKFKELLDKYNIFFSMISQKPFNEQYENLKNFYSSSLEDKIIIRYRNELENLFYGFFKELKNNPIYDWIYQKFEKGLLRLKNKELPIYLDLLAAGSDPNNIYESIVKIFDKFDPPVILDRKPKNKLKKGILFKINNEELEIALAIRNLYYLYKKTKNNRVTKFKCPMFNMCDHRMKNEDCKKSPWKKGSEEESCNMGKAAKFYGIV